MLFVIDENSFGRLTCYLSCALPPLQSAKDVRDFGLTGFADPDLINRLPEREIVLVGRDKRMLSQHRLSLKSRPGISVLILDIGKKSHATWNELCGAMIQRWEGIQHNFERNTSQSVFKLDLRRIRVGSPIFEKLPF